MFTGSVLVDELIGGASPTLLAELYQRVRLGGLSGREPPRRQLRYGQQIGVVGMCGGGVFWYAGCPRFCELASWNGNHE